MRLARIGLVLCALFAIAPTANAQRIIAQLSGLAIPDHVIDFGAASVLVLLDAQDLILGF